MHRSGAMLPAVHLTLWHWHVAVSAYPVALAVAALVGIAAAVRRAPAPDLMLVVASLAAFAGMASAEAWHRVVHASPGLSSMGGVAGGLVAVAVAARIARVSTRALLDALAPGALAGFAIGRVGCLLAGCCYGRVTDGWWGVVLTEVGPEPRHPVQLAEAILDLAVGWWCARVPGPSAARGMIGYAAVRMLLEPLRDPAAADVVSRSGTSAVPFGALVLVALGLVLTGRGPRPRFRSSRTV